VGHEIAAASLRSAAILNLGEDFRLEFDYNLRYSSIILRSRIR